MKQVLAIVLALALTASAANKGWCSAIPFDLNFLSAFWDPIMQVWGQIEFYLLYFGFMLFCDLAPEMIQPGKTAAAYATITANCKQYSEFEFRKKYV